MEISSSENAYKKRTKEIDEANESEYKKSFDKDGLHIENGILIAISQETSQ